MVKRALVTALVLSGLMFSGMAEKCLGSTTSTQLSINSLTTGADAAGLLEQAEQARIQWHLDQTEAIYGQILADYPGGRRSL